MSRSALWKQEGKVKERERRAEAIFEAAVEEGRSRSAKSVMPLWGPDDSFHFNPLLLQNTIHSPYFQKCCENLKDWNAVVDEIYYEVKHLLPFQVGKSPSTAFCLLLRLLTLRVTPHQLDLTLKHVDSPYIRCVGFLYLRYVGPPEEIWNWISPYLHDDEPVQVQTGKPETTVGEYVRQLFSDREYHGTPLPRFPVLVERDLRAKLLQADSVAERAKQHYKNAGRMKFFETLGSRVMAMYADEENPIDWYEAVVDRVIRRSDEDGEGGGQQLKYPKFVVTFTEYGNTETVTLGEMDVLDGDWKRSRRPGGGSGAGGGGVDADDWYEEVRQRERGNVTASKGWARQGRPPSTKSSLSTVDKRNSSRGSRGDVDDHGGPRRQNHQSKQRKHDDRDSRGHYSDRRPAAASSQAPARVEASAPSKKRTAQEIAEIEEKKRRLMKKYG